MLPSKKLMAICAIVISCVGCSRPQPGPDKALAGAVLGAGWGAGTGAIIGNNLVEENPTGEAAAIGAGFGLVSGALAGLNYDLIETTQIEQEQELASLRIQNMANGQQLARLQGQLDRNLGKSSMIGVYQVFFDPDGTDINAGAIANLEVIADGLKKNPQPQKIHVVGHSDDGGDPEYNSRLAEARATKVAAYLGARGISSDQIVIKSFGAKHPIATNNTPEGRQLNRRVDIYLAK